MPASNWPRVKEVFHEALRFDTGERDSFLDKACGGDIELRIEVESLLVSLQEAKSFLERPLISESKLPARGWRLKNGQDVSHYRVISPIASGGMGEVYLAEDLKLRRRVALKTLRDEVASDASRLRRFQREADAVSALNHPNILTIFEFDVFDEVHFFASEYVNGDTLRKRLENGSLSVGEALDIALQIASALKAAHDAGVVHRDIKPENIMVREDGYVKILDFGLAKLTGPMEGDGNIPPRPEFVSHPGLIMGTAAYMSPEQAKGLVMDLRSDIFSLGVVLYEMLSGISPFKSETHADVIAAIIQISPKPLSPGRGDIPEEVDQIIEKMVEKTAAARYQGAADLIADLKKVIRTVDANSVLKKVAGTPQPSSDRAFTGRYLPIAIAAVLLAVVFIFLYRYLIS